MARHNGCPWNYSVSEQTKVNKPNLALLLFLFTIPAAAYGQSVARVTLAGSEALAFDSRAEIKTSEHRIPARRALLALQRLQNDVILYRSLGDFEETGKLARVPIEIFQDHLREVSAEVEAILLQLPQGRLKTEISNALSSYQDGAFWWSKIHQPRVVHVSAFVSPGATRTPSDAAYYSTTPYTVAINWRQAAKCARRAEEILSAQRP